MPASSDFDPWKLLVVGVLITIQLSVYLVYNLIRAHLTTKDPLAWIPSLAGQSVSIVIPAVAFFYLELDNLLRYIPSVYMLPGLAAILPMSVCILYPSTPIFALSNAVLCAADGFDVFLVFLTVALERAYAMPVWALFMPLRHVIWWLAYKRVRRRRSFSADSSARRWPWLTDSPESAKSHSLHLHV